MAKLWYRDYQTLLDFMSGYYKNNTIPTFTNPNLEKIVLEYKSLFNKENDIELRK